jgi:hypothetical protein
MTELQARRELLLERCAAQRLELSRRLNELRGSLPLAGLARGGAGVAAQGARHPLAWLAVLGALLAFARTRRVLSLFMVLRSALTFTTRAATLMKILSEWRAAGRARSGAAERGAAAPPGPKL